MRVVLTDVETIPEWISPGSWPDLTTSEGDAIGVSFERADVERLWRALDPTCERSDALVPQQYESIGLPHDVPDDVERFHSDLVAALAGVPAQERWRVAQRWAATERRPNKETLADAKRMVNALCELAVRARQTGRELVLLP